MFAEALREADDEALLSVLDERTDVERATRVVRELARRARRGPEPAVAVCERVLRARLYLDGSDVSPYAPAGDRLGRRLRVRNAITLYEALVRPGRRTATCPG
ncbi:hypothetical protein NKH77_38735 [Streptomyces sp. M19]